MDFKIFKLVLNVISDKKSDICISISTLSNLLVATLSSPLICPLIHFALENIFRHFNLVKCWFLLRCNVVVELIEHDDRGYLKIVILFYGSLSIIS